ncbi:MAG: molybdate ABC transporter permease subunit, partial [Herbinix sp.]|nr:molybdate ABC transporter permease subunit [Herbinix sp.]
MMRGKRKQVIPGFGISMGVTITLLSLIVLIPMASLVFNASSMGYDKFIETVTDKRIVSGYLVSFSCSFIAALINAVFGVILSWVLVRYEFPFKRLVDGLI